MCCMWWKKIVSPRYEVNIQTYQAISRFLSSSGISNLSLIVADNNFNAEKARVLFEGVSASKLKGFSFNNVGLDCNYLEN